MVKTSTIPEAALEVIAELVDDGKTPTEIATALNRAGLRRRGGKTFARHHIRTLLQLSPKTPDPGPLKGGPLSKTPPKTPEPMAAEIVEGSERWRPGRIDIDSRRLALPNAKVGITTQTKRELQIQRLEDLIDETAKEYKEAEAENKQEVLLRLLRLLRLYDTHLVSAERAEVTHSKVAHAVFILNNGSGSPTGVPDLPDPGDEPLPGIFTQEAKAYMEELGGSWDVFLERLKGE